MFRFLYLFPATKNKYYIGHTGDVMEERLRKHNSNHKRFAGRAGDWKIVYTELFPTKREAYRKEREIKAWKSRVKLKL